MASWNQENFQKIASVMFALFILNHSSKSTVAYFSESSFLTRRGKFLMLIFKMTFSRKKRI